MKQYEHLIGKTLWYKTGEKRDCFSFAGQITYQAICKQEKVVNISTTETVDGSASGPFIVFESGIRVLPRDVFVETLLKPAKSKSRNVTKEEA